jgi:hypothetical protein
MDGRTDGHNRTGGHVEHPSTTRPAIQEVGAYKAELRHPVIYRTTTIASRKRGGRAERTIERLRRTLPYLPEVVVAEREDGV